VRFREDDKPLSCFTECSIKKNGADTRRVDRRDHVPLMLTTTHRDANDAQMPANPDENADPLVVGPADGQHSGLRPLFRDATHEQHSRQYQPDRETIYLRTSPAY
jgi:hypothetical protein